MRVGGVHEFVFVPCDIYLDLCGFSVFHRVEGAFRAAFGVPKNQVRKNSLNIKFLCGMFLGHLRPRRRDIPDKNFMQAAFFCCFRQGVAGMSRDLGRDVPDLEKLYARKLCADFSYLTKNEKWGPAR